MKDKKLQVFVSSTYVDLKEERQAAVEAILSAGHIPAGMELFSAGDESQMTVIKRWIDESDVYLLILGGRYGSIDPSSGKSYTHLEYEYAIEQGKPLFAVVIREEAIRIKISKEGPDAIEQVNPHLLREFKFQVSGNLVEFWNDTKDIQLAIYKTLSDFIYRKNLVGWVRADNSVNTGLLAEEIARLTKENSELKFKTNNQQLSNQLYNNLTYDELKTLLKGRKVSIDNVNSTMLEFLTTNTELLYYDDWSVEKYSILMELELLKILKREDDRYKFTDDGHNFYLRALLETYEN